MGVVANTLCGSRSDQAYYYENCGSSGHRYAIYPNPVSSTLTIGPVNEQRDVAESQSITHGETRDEQLENVVLSLYDFSGNIVKEKNLIGRAENVSIDVSDIGKGIYYLRIYGEEVDETHRVIIE